MNDNITIIIIIIIIIIQSTNQDVKKAHESWSARWNWTVTDAWSWILIERENEVR